MGYSGDFRMMEFSTPEHKTNNLLLRWFANYVSSPFAYYFFTKGLRISFKYEDKTEKDPCYLMPRRDYFMMNLYYRIYYIANKPYERWGTMYKIDMEAWTKSIKDDPVLDKLRSDYDKDGIPYWEKDEDRN